MQNKIVNLTATAADWDTLTGLPHKTLTISIQARTAVDVLYRWARDSAGSYWTIKSGTTRTITGQLYDGDLEFQAAAGTVIEVEASTRGATL